MFTKSSNPMTRAVLSLLVVFALFYAIILSNSTAQAAITTVQVGQTNGGGVAANQFNSAAITVATGDTVRWVRFAGSHNVVSVTPGLIELPPGAIAAGDAMAAGVNYDFTFATAGTYYYFCNIHANAGDATDANIASGAKMVGKVTVVAPTPDTAAPTVSAVAAAPNPTNGSGSVALTATVTDTSNGTAAANVAAAEWSKGASAATAGAGTAMAGTFGGATANVSATVPITETPPTSVTIWVRGKDVNNNWSAPVSTVLSVTAVPAGSIQATVTLTAGGLSNSTQAGIAFGSVALTGATQTKLSAPAGAWVATDARGNGAGWNVTVAATDFTGAGSIPAANLKTQLLQSTITPAGPVSQVLAFQPLGATALKILNATGAAGNGSFDYAPDFQLTIPASAGAGSYSANVTVSINSGP